MNHPPTPPTWTPPPPPRWGRFTAWTGAAAIAAFAIGGGIATLTDRDSANPAACKTALAENYQKAVANGPGGPTMPAPPACAGLSHTELRRITEEVFSEYLDSDQADEDMERLIREAMESAAAQP